MLSTNYQSVASVWPIYYQYITMSFLITKAGNAMVKNAEFEQLDELPNTREFNVLIVDDDDMDRHYFGELLSVNDDYCYQYQTADSLAQARQEVRKHNRFLLFGQDMGTLVMGPENEGWVLKGDQVCRIEYRGGNLKDGVFIAELAPNYHIPFTVKPLVCFSEPEFIQGKDLLAVMHDFCTLVQSTLEIFD